MVYSYDTTRDTVSSIPTRFGVPKPQNTPATAGAPTQASVAVAAPSSSQLGPTSDARAEGSFRSSKTSEPTSFAPSAATVLAPSNVASASTSAAAPSSAHQNELEGILQRAGVVLSKYFEAGHEADAGQLKQMESALERLLDEISTRSRHRQHALNDADDGSNALIQHSSHEAVQRERERESDADDDDDDDDEGEPTERRTLMRTGKVVAEEIHTQMSLQMNSLATTHAATTAMLQAQIEELTRRGGTEAADKLAVAERARERSEADLVAVVGELQRVEDLAKALSQRQRKSETVGKMQGLMRKGMAAAGSDKSAELQSQLAEERARAAALEDSIIAMQEQMTDASRGSMSALTDELNAKESLTARMSELSGELSAANDHRAQLEADLLAAREQASRTEDRLTNAQRVHSDEIAAAQENIRKEMSKAGKMSEELKQISSRMTAMEKHTKEMQESTAVFQEEAESLRSKCDKKDEQLASLRQQVTALKLRFAAAMEEVRNSREQLEKSGDLDAWMSEVAAKEAALTARAQFDLSLLGREVGSLEKDARLGGDREQMMQRKLTELTMACKDSERELRATSQMMRVELQSDDSEVEEMRHTLKKLQAAEPKVVTVIEQVAAPAADPPAADDSVHVAVLISELRLIESTSHMTNTDLKEIVTRVDSVRECAEIAVQTASRLGEAMKSIATSTNGTPAVSIAGSKHDSRQSTRPASRQTGRGSPPPQEAAPPPIAATPPAPPPAPAPAPVVEASSDDALGGVRVLLDRLSAVEQHLSPSIVAELQQDVDSAIDYATSVSLEMRKLIRQLSGAFPRQEWGNEEAKEIAERASRPATAASRASRSSRPTTADSLGIFGGRRGSVGEVVPEALPVDFGDDELMMDESILPASALGDAVDFCSNALDTFEPSVPGVAVEAVDDELEARLESVSRLEDELREVLVHEEQRAVTMAELADEWAHAPADEGGIEEQMASESVAAAELVRDALGESEKEIAHGRAALERGQLSWGAARERSLGDLSGGAAGAPSAPSMAAIVEEASDADRKSRREATLRLRDAEQRLIDTLAAMHEKAARDSAPSTRPATRSATPEPLLERPMSGRRVADKLTGAVNSQRLANSRDRLAASNEEVERLTDELAAVNARAEAMAKFLEGFSPDDLARSGDLRAAHGEIEKLDAENAELRRAIGIISPGFHGLQRPWSPRLVPGSSPVMAYPRMLSARRNLPVSSPLPHGLPPGDLGRVSPVNESPATAPSDAPGPAASRPLTSGAVEHRVPAAAPIDPAALARSQSRGVTQRMVAVDMATAAKWGAKRAQLEKDRQRGFEQRMQAFASVSYTGEPVAKMHSLYADEGADANDPALPAVDAVSGSAPPRKRGTISAKSARASHVASGSGRMTVLAGPAGRVGVGGSQMLLQSLDTGIRASASLPAL